jgi:hypothetical protein
MCELSLLIRALKVPLPVVETADGVSSYPDRISLIFLKPWANAIEQTDTKAITARDNPSLRIPFSSKILFCGARIIPSKTNFSHKKAQKAQKLFGTHFVLFVPFVYLVFSLCR